VKNRVIARDLVIGKPSRFITRGLPRQAERLPVAEFITNALMGAVTGLAVLALIALTAGCGAAEKNPVHVAHVPYVAHFDAKNCRYLPDGIRFKCKDVVFDPKEIHLKESH
jgi:hypothetical protein